MRSKRGILALMALAALALASCGPANERPVRGAVPGSEAPTPPGVPPTLTASEALRLRPLPLPSPGLAVGPTPSAVASPSAVAAPPIVRTIAPSAGGHVPAGAPVTLSAVLVGRGADLATASLAVNGADSGAQIDKRTAREWTIHTSQPLGTGTYTARVLVHDASGAAGGFTWQFLVGDETGVGEATPKPSVATSPVPKPHNP
jgi:hypothetical protein